MAEAMANESRAQRQEFREELLAQRAEFREELAVSREHSERRAVAADREIGRLADSVDDLRSVIVTD